MNKLGFYIEVTTVPFLRDALRQVKPPTILLHAGDRGLLREIRRDLSPDSFIVGRIFIERDVQLAWLDSDDPAQRGREFADRIINYDFGLALERGANDRLLIDAWMSLNEALPGPASFPNFQVSDEFRRRAEALDRFQVAFRERLQSKGLEAVAFNFAAGNFIYPEHYLDWFPRSLESYTYLGFHEYGWPTLMEDPSRGSKTSATYYRRCMEGIRQRYGNRHRVIITEAGLARMYKYPNDPAGDVGWLYPDDPIPEEQYWESLRWYNSELVKDDYVLGCCLFQVGHSGRWETFRHLGKDNQQRPIQIISRIATLNQEETPEPPAPPTPPPSEIKLPELQAQIGQLIAILEPAAAQASGLPNRVTQLQQTLQALTQQVQPAASLPGKVTTLLNRVATLEARAAGAGVDGLQQRIADVKAQLLALQPTAQQLGQLPGQVDQANSQLESVAAEANQLATLRSRLADLLAEARELKATADNLTPGAVEPPEMRDVRATLPRHPTKRFPTRSQDSIRRVLLHHTVTRSNITPERIAEVHVQRGLAGIKYHFLVDGSGTISWCQPLEAIVPQTERNPVNADSVAVALAGNFTSAVPTESQMTAAAHLVAWLLSTLGLGVDAVYGRSELDSSVDSPGKQWLQGARYKDTFLSKVRGFLGQQV